MQTFLPHPAFAECARALDDRRLGKQRVETMQILRALVWPAYGWKRHPAVAMWRGFVPALVGYGVAVCREWRRRGHADSVLPSLLAFTGGRVPEEEELWERDLLPPWLGDGALHVSHRSALVYKDPAHYGPLFPEAPGGLPYVWPRPVFPRWPLRRGTTEAMPLGEAMKLLEADAPPSEQAAALERLAGGRSASLRLTGPGDTVPGLLAGLCTPGEDAVAGTRASAAQAAGLCRPGPLGGGRADQPVDRTAARARGRSGDAPGSRRAGVPIPPDRPGERNGGARAVLGRAGRPRRRRTARAALGPAGTAPAAPGRGLDDM